MGMTNAQNVSGGSTKVYRGTATAGTKITLGWRPKYISSRGAHTLGEGYTRYDADASAKFVAHYFDTSAVGHLAPSYGSVATYIKIEDDGLTFLNSNYAGAFFASTDE